MRVVFMGTPDFAVETLKAIVEAGHEVAAVVTQPDKPKGRGGAMAMSPVKEKALEYGLTVLQPEKARSEAFVEELRSCEPDVIVVVAFGQILSDSILYMPKYGCINVHASLLPKYRGASPIQWAVIDGCEYSGVTTMLMDTGIDTGDILLSEKVKLEPKETGGSLFEKLSHVGAKLLVKTLECAQNGTLQPVKQNDDEAVYVKMLDKSFGLIDFQNPAVKTERLIRGLNPWPSAFTHLDGKILKIWDADVVGTKNQTKNQTENQSELQTGNQAENQLELQIENKSENKDNRPDCGTIISVDKKSFTVQCGEGALKVNEVQLEGKKRMTTADFLRGYRLELGQKLG